MRANEFLNEKSKDWQEVSAAGRVLRDLYLRMNAKYFTKQKPAPIPVTDAELPEVLKQAKQAIKISGRSDRVYVSSDGYQTSTSGYLYDQIMLAVQERLQAKGQQVAFPRTGNSIRGFTQTLAQYFKGLNAHYTTSFARKWTRSTGGSYSDPSNHLEFDSEENMDTAWEELVKHGKRVYVKDHPQTSPTEYVKIGPFLIRDGTTVRGAFGNNPETNHRLSITTTGILKNPINQVQDISDQQAASLRDIASTQTQNAMEKLKTLMNIFQGEDDMKRIIDNSKKIAPQDKAKLDAIIAGAQNFKEP